LRSIQERRQRSIGYVPIKEREYVSWNKDYGEQIREKYEATRAIDLRFKSVSVNNGINLLAYNKYVLDEIIKEMKKNNNQTNNKGKL
jgi:hypothetical protein